MATTIREAAAEDLPGLAGLRWAWSEEGRPAIQSSFEDYARGLTSWYAERDDVVAYVADDGGDLVAMGFLALVARVPDPRAFDRRTGDIQSVYVRPQHRNQGLGARVVDALVEHGRSAGCTRITVHSDERAISLYSRAGFSSEPHLLMLPFG